MELKVPPFTQPTTGKASEMSETEYRDWWSEQVRHNARATASAAVTAAELRDNPAMLDEFRLFAAQFPHYNRITLANSMRLWAQNRSATRVQGGKWWLREGREPKADAVPVFVEALYQRSRTEERENKETGETEEVTSHRKAMVGAPVYDVTQTVPKEGVTCILCRTEPGQECPADCPVYQPESGRIPSRFAVLMECATQLKNAGGIDAEAILADLPPDPYRDGDRVQGVNSFVISVPRFGGRKKALRVHVSHDDKGRTRYAVVRVGVFWLSLDTGEYERGYQHGDRLKVQYGDDPQTPDYRMDNGERSRPGAPVVNSVHLAGHGYFNPATTSPNGRYSLYVGRPGRFSSSSAPEKTAHAVGAIVHHLGKHWTGQPNREELRDAHERHHAPYRKAEHDRRADMLREQVDRLTAELAEQMEAAARQAALLQQDSTPEGMEVGA